MKVSTGERAKYSLDAGSLPINCVFPEGLVPSRCRFHTGPATPRLGAAWAVIPSFRLMVSLGCACVCPPPSAILPCQLHRYFSGTYSHVHQTLYSHLLSPPPTSFYSPTSFCCCSEIQFLKLVVEGGYLPKSKLTVALPLLQTQGSPALLIRLNCFQLTNITSCCCFFFFKFENGRDTIRKFTFANMIFN